MIKFAFVIVTYRQHPYNTKTWMTLSKSIQQSGASQQCGVFIFDNSEVDFDTNIQENSSVVYIRNKANPGLSVAYNTMASIAISMGYEWLILLDQDSSLPSNAIVEYIASVNRTSNSSLIRVPLIMVNSFVFSPLRVIFIKSLKRKNLPCGTYPFSKFVIINSGIMLSLAFYKQIGGYDERIKLDFTDIEFIERAALIYPKFEVLPINIKHDYSFHSNDIDSAMLRYRQYRKDYQFVSRKGISAFMKYHLSNWIHLYNLSIHHKSTNFIKLYLGLMK